MPSREWLRAPRHLLVSFLAITVVPVAVLAWLAWRIVEQDRALAEQTVRDRLEHAADVIVGALERDLVGLEERLAESPPTIKLGSEDDALIVTFAGDRSDVVPPSRLPYYPTTPSSVDPPHVFEAGEDLEFRRYDYPGAIRTFRELSRSPDVTVRGEALLRLARSLRKNGQPEEALSVYDALAKLGLATVVGAPAELVARDARCTVLAELGRRETLVREAAALAEDLRTARWRLDRASWLLYSDRAQRWLDARDVATADTSTLALADGVDRLWNLWRETRYAEAGAPRRLTWWVGDSPILVLWRASRDTVAAFVAGPRFVEARHAPAWRTHQVVVALADADGRLVLGQPVSPERPTVARYAGESRLPWTVRVSSANAGVELAQLAGRRRLLLSGLGVTALLTMLGGYLTVRATARELAVARLQSDFVSAVSHEFRTPLTSLRHLTELLESGKVDTEDRRRQYYAVLARETERLHRMVEGLLEFGRLEAGRRQYEFEEVNPVQFVTDVVTDFRAEIESTGRHVEMNVADLGPQAPHVRVDREAIGRAIRNLLENAVRYSIAPAPVSVEVTREGKRVVIRVRDEGVGIPREEQAMIFDQFVRGSAARALNAKGTGVGLSMVRHIIRAHGGEISVRSEPGRGSTFSVVLPAVGFREAGGDA